MAPHRPPTEATPIELHRPPSLQEASALLLDYFRTELSKLLAAGLYCHFWKFGTPPPRAPFRTPMRESSTRYSRHQIQQSDPPPLCPAPNNGSRYGLILLGDSEKKVLLDSGGQERETRRRLPLSPLSSALIPSGWSPHRCGLLTFVFWLCEYLRLAKWLQFWSL